MPVVKRWLVIVGIFLLFVIVAEATVSRIMSQAVAQGMNSLVASEKVSAQVAKRPSIAMLAGSFDQVNIDTVNTKIDKISFSEMHIAMNKVQLDREKLFFRREIAVRDVQEVNLSAVLAQEEIARYISQNVKGVKNVKVTVTSGKVEAVSLLSLGSIASLAVTLDGKIVSDGQRIKFVTDRFLLNNNAVGNVGGAVLTEIPLVELKNMPFGVKVKDIVMEDGKVTLVADNKK